MTLPDRTKKKADIGTNAKQQQQISMMETAANAAAQAFTPAASSAVIAAMSPTTNSPNSESLCSAHAANAANAASMVHHLTPLPFHPTQSNIPAAAAAEVSGLASSLCSSSSSSSESSSGLISIDATPRDLVLETADGASRESIMDWLKASRIADENKKSQQKIVSSMSITTPAHIQAVLDSLQPIPSSASMANSAMMMSFATHEELTASASVPPPPPASQMYDGEPVENFRVVKILGEGSFGKVYHALHTKELRHVAIKEIYIRPDMRSNKSGMDILDREVQLMQKADHPHVVRPYGSYRTKETLYLYMELVDGESMESLVQREKGLSEHCVRGYCTELLQALQFLHSIHIIHRDLKGKNILVGKKDGKCKLCDFGASKEIIEGNQHRMDFTASKGYSWTPLYVAPEVVRDNRYNEKADIWSLGCCAVEMLSGELPWNEHKFRDHDHCYSVLLRPGSIPAIPVRCSRACRHFIRRCLTRDPKRRPSAEELLRHPFILGNEMKEEEIKRRPRTSSQQSSPAKAAKKGKREVSEFDEKDDVPPPPPPLADTEGIPPPPPPELPMDELSSKCSTASPPTPTAPKVSPTRNMKLPAAQQTVREKQQTIGTNPSKNIPVRYEPTHHHTPAASSAVVNNGMRQK